MKNQQEKEVRKQDVTKQKNTKRKTEKMLRDQQEALTGEGIVLSMPLIPLRGLTVFPGVNLTFDVARERSRAAVQSAMDNNQLVFLATQKDPAVDWPDHEDIYHIGCVARIRQVLELPNSDNMKLLVEGRQRAKLHHLTGNEEYDRAEVIYLIPDGHDPDQDMAELEAYRRRLLHAFEQYAAISSRVSPETLIALTQIDDASLAADAISGQLSITTIEKQQLLEAVNTAERILKLIGMIEREQYIAQLEKEINDKVRSTIEKNQKDYYLREQMKTIQKELGEQEGSQEELDNYLKLLDQTPIPEDAKPKIRKDINRLAKMPAGYPEGAVLRNYMDLLFEMPWGKMDKERLNIKQARRILNRDHYGLEKVKERILEYLAVRKMRFEAGETTIKGPILCLVGPPGVGKTSIARSVAESIGRKYIRMSLGGVRDEAEIRGHRRTYVGAMPGRIINAIRQAGRDNPLILLDEIDKLGNDFRGDPSSALLEVLDPEQNYTFRDHYLEIPYDLSHVLFITTANSTETIPRALFDRMEIVYLSGYTDEEKIEIAGRHLLPNQLKQNALSKEQLKMQRPAIRALINGYTREAGVRQLERELAHVCRRAAIRITEQGDHQVTVKPTDLEDMIGKKKYRFETAVKVDQVGVATGLAWTWAGGDTLNVEVNVMPGSGKLELTGQLGDVMKESASAAVTYIRSCAENLKIKSDFSAKVDIHIHVPEGATPKDGPSAGITLATALASALSGRPVRRQLAMTGEITLRGRVLPIGGLKEKVIAAHRAGIQTVLLPAENRRDAEDIPKTVREKLDIVFVSNMDDVLKAALI